MVPVRTRAAAAVQSAPPRALPVPRLRLSFAPPAPSTLHRLVFSVGIIKPINQDQEAGGDMARGCRRLVLAAVVLVAVLVPHFTAQPPTAEKSIEKDRSQRQAAAKAGKQVAATPKWGFFGTIFHLILEQINDTKSAYNQITELVGNQFDDGNTVTKAPKPDSDGDSTQPPKISRQEFLKILDRNLKGLARLRDLEWREAKKDSWTNIRGYKDEIFKGKKSTKR